MSIFWTLLSLDSYFKILCYPFCETNKYPVSTLATIYCDVTYYTSSIFRCQNLKYPNNHRKYLEHSHRLTEDAP